MKPHLLLALASLALTACAASPSATRPQGPSLPPPPLERVEPQGSTAFRNDDLADLLVRLTFQLESGDRLTSVPRLEEPVRVVPDVRFDAETEAALQAVVDWTARHAGIDIAYAPERSAEAPGTLGGSVIAVTTVSPVWLAQAAPTVGCFVLPGPPIDLERQRRRIDFDEQLATWQERQIATVYVPEGVREPRRSACFFEEIVQSTGLYNDIFDLLPSIFTDEGLHIVPTALDMLMLRTLYALPKPTLGNRQATRTAARVALADLNPDGEGAAARPLGLAPPPVISRVRRFFEGTARGNGGRVPRQTLERLITSTDTRHNALHCALRDTLAIIATREEDPGALDLLDRAEQACRRSGIATPLRFANIDVHRALAFSTQQRPVETLEALDGTTEVLEAYGIPVSPEMKQLVAMLRIVIENGT
ncbi:MAG: DUF2927 domain-containing protein [Pseudomonadota bacterium]